MVHLYTGVHMFVGFWMQHLQTGGLGEMVRHPGHHDRRISPPPPESSLWGYIKDKVFSTPVPDITNLKARITNAFATITEDMLENTWREIDHRLDVLHATKGASVEVCYCVVKNLLSWVAFWKKKYVCIPRSFLVINVCNLGKTLCSPCRSSACQMDMRGNQLQWDKIVTNGHITEFMGI